MSIFDYFKKKLKQVLNGSIIPETNNQAIRSIEDVTNPLLNSINEKSSRIRAAFIAEVHSSLADQYYIVGKSGEQKKIVLPRNLVVWE